MNHSVQHRQNIFLRPFAHLNKTFLQQSLKIVVKQCVEKLDVGWIFYDTNSGDDTFFFCRIYCDWKESSKYTPGRKEIVSDLLCVR